MKKKFSIITVCRNVSGDLVRTSESVLNQTYDDFEYIVVDGASTDATPDILQRLKKQNVIIVSEPDKGIYDAMNKGVGLSSGEWIIFMNAGDTFYSDSVLEEISKYIDSYTSEVDVIYGDVAKLDKDGKLYIKKAERPHNSHRMYFCHQCVFTKRSELIEHPFDINHPLSADFKFFKLLFKESKQFKYIPVPIALFDTNGVSNRRRSAGLRDNIKVIKEVDGYIKGLPKLLRIYPSYLSAKVRKK